MDWNDIKDNMIWIIGAFLATWQLVDDIRKKKSKVKIVVLFIGVIVFCLLGLDQNKRIRNDKKISESKLNDLTGNVNILKERISSDSTIRVSDSINDVAFQTSLFKEFKIIRDSFSNKPVQTNYTTNIKNAKEVHIGPN